MDERWIEAEAWRRTGQWAKAGAYFHDCLRQRPAPSAAWRYAFCLRKAGYPEAALGVASRALSQWPDQEAVRWELGWCLYAARLQPAMREEGQEEKVLEAAREMVAAGAEGLALQLVVFAAVGAARRRGQWGEVLAWCDRLNPDQLSDRSQEGQKRIPPLERWHLARVKALVHLERWDEGASAAQRAQETYPRNADFLRWRAQCLYGQGDREGSCAILEQHLGAPRKHWYVLADLARLRFELGDAQSALELAQEAVCVHGEDHAKVNLFLLLARLHASRSEWAHATNWLGWCLQLRADRGWPIKAAHQEALAQLERAGHSLSTRSAREWKTSCLDSLLRSEDRRRGKVEGCEAARPFCFLRDGQGRYFILSRDLPPDCRKNGVEVEFSVFQGFDRKKGVPALQARSVRRCP